MFDFEVARRQMVEQQLKRRKIESAAVLDAMGKVPREAFVPKRSRELAYRDNALPIAAGQTISQPYIVALMAEAAQATADDKVLEIGTGSGYSAAVLAEIAGQVFSVERIEELADAANTTLQQLGYQNIQVQCRDGTLGWPEEAPFDAIVVTAGGPKVPESLLQQLKIGGRLVIPVGELPDLQNLTRITRVDESNFQQEDLGAVRFVKLIGREGWGD